MRAPQVVACDVAVVGAGPAGLAAALRAATLGLKVVLVTRSRPGGRLRQTPTVPVVEGLPVGISGSELTERAIARARRLGVGVITAEAIDLTAKEGPRQLALSGGGRVEAQTVIVATGADRTTGDIEGWERLLGAGVHTRAPEVRDKPFLAGETIVAGEPTEAAGAALVLSTRCERVALVTPGGALARAIPPALLAELRGRGNITASPHTAVVAAEGVDRLEVVVLRDSRTGRLRTRTASSLWLVGAERARTAWLPSVLERDAGGRLVTGRKTLPSETALRGVFAAGDARVGSPCGLDVMAEGVDTAEQVSARLGLDLESSA